MTGYTLELSLGLLFDFHRIRKLTIFNECKSTQFSKDFRSICKSFHIVYSVVKAIDILKSTKDHSCTRVEKGGGGTSCTP